MIVSNDSGLQVVVRESLEAMVGPALKQMENFMLGIYILPALSLSFVVGMREFRRILVTKLFLEY